MVCGYIFLIALIGFIKVLFFEGRNLTIEIILIIIAGVIAVLGILKYKKLQKIGQKIPRWIFWVLILLLILTLILIGTTIFTNIFLEPFTGNIKNTETGIPTINREDLANKREIKDSITEDALALLDVEKCYEIENDELGQDLCILVVAKKLQDASICKKISDNIPAQKHGCIQTIAKEKQDISICNIFDEIEIISTGLIAQKGSCYRGVAIENDDSSICELIENDNEKWICENNFN